MRAKTHVQRMNHSHNNIYIRRRPTNAYVWRWIWTVPKQIRFYSIASAFSMLGHRTQHQTVDISKSVSWVKNGEENEMEKEGTVRLAARSEARARSAKRRNEWFFILN